MAIEVSSDRAICSKCGTQYSRRKGYFAVSYAESHKGIGHCHLCKGCIEELYSRYLSQCNDPMLAVRQVCRKIDIYWNRNLFEQTFKKSTTKTIMTQYMAKLNGISLAGKSYDDTLLEEGTLWDFNNKKITTKSMLIDSDKSSQDDECVYEPPDEVKAFWGYGYTPEMYKELEQRRSFWMARFPSGIQLDIGTEALIRQICNLEIDINRDRIAGKPIDKSVNALNNLLGSANLKPTQRKDELDSSITNTPLGVWIYRFENERPLPEIDDDLKDVNGLKKYIFTWMGHLCKMLGVKNGYTRLYDEEIQRLRVERPEYNDEDDESLLIDSFGSEDNKGGSA